MLTELTRAQVFNAFKIKWICKTENAYHNLLGSMSLTFHFPDKLTPASLIA